ncbi:MAG: hypothetical protein AAFP13_12215 [Pseudomonadota bacterium]
MEASAKAALAPSIHGAEVRARGRLVILSGTVDSVSEREALLASLAGVDGSRAVLDETTLLPTADPYTLAVTRAGGEVTAVSGHTPTEAAREALRAGLGEGAAALTLAFGAPPGWVGAATASLAAMGALRDAELRIVEAQVSLRGLAPLPPAQAAAEAALDTLPAGFTAEVSITLEDDGRPFALDIDYRRGGEVRAQGKVPRAMGAAGLAALLGEGATLRARGLVTARIDSPDGTWREAGAAAIDALAALDAGRLRLEGRQGTLEGTGTRASHRAVAAVLATLPAGYEITTALGIADDGRPILLEATKAEDGVEVSGKVPFGATAAALGLARVPGGLTVAEIDAESADFMARARAGLAALRQTRRGRLTVRDAPDPLVALSGEVGVPSEAEALLTTLRATLGQGAAVLEVDLTPLDDGRPLRLEAARAAGVTTANGKLPMDAALDLGPGVTRAGIALGPTGFEAAAKAGLAALALLETGRLTVEGPLLTLEGEGTRSRLRAALRLLDALPEAFEARTELAPIDDGLPLGFTAEKAGDTVTLLGKMPFGTEPAALGLAAFEEAMIVSEVDAKSPDFIAVSQAGLRALTALRSGRLVVADGEEAGEPAQLRIEGSVTRSELEAVNAALGSLPRGVAPVIDVVFADDGRPMALSARKDAAGLALVGKLPFGTAPDDLGLEAFGDGITVAEIAAVDDDFTASARRGLAALDRLETGTLTVRDAEPEGQATSLTLAGSALTPADLDEVRRILDAEEARLDVAVLDDGTPPAFVLRYATDTGASLTGKLPAGLSPAEIAAALGLDAITGSARTGRIGDASTVDPGALAPWLPEIAALEARFGPGGIVALEIAPEPGVEAPLLTGMLEEALGVDVTLRETALPAPGAQRRNLLAGRDERFVAGAWLPSVGFEASRDLCEAEGRAVLSERVEIFQSGTSRLTAAAPRVLNPLASVVGHCLAALPGLRVAVVGSASPAAAEEEDEAGAPLGLARARAVITALIARGVATGAISAAEPTSTDITATMQASAAPGVALVWSQP